jgi:hypothetical protein
MRRYNDRLDYKFKPVVGQKFVAARHSGSGKSGGNGKNNGAVGTEALQPDPPRIFSSKSAWADLKATVVNYHTHFQIKVESTTPAEKWILEKADSNHTVISSGGLNEQYNFVIDQPGNFVPGQFVLRVINTSDGNQYPSLFPLK